MKDLFSSVVTMSSRILGVCVCVIAAEMVNEKPIAHKRFLVLMRLRCDELIGLENREYSGVLSHSDEPFISFS